MQTQEAAAAAPKNPLRGFQSFEALQVHTFFLKNINLLSMSLLHKYDINKSNQHDYTLGLNFFSDNNNKIIY
ncbi:MAG: hypothetical protein RR141_01640 [Rikenellaceae bacterium]